MHVNQSLLLIHFDVPECLLSEALQSICEQIHQRSLHVATDLLPWLE